MNDDDDDGDIGFGDLESASAPASEPTPSDPPPALIITTTGGEMPSSPAAIADLRDVLARHGALRCLRFEASCERAIAYYDDRASAQQATGPLAEAYPHLRGQLVPVTLYAAEMSLPYTASLIEDYLRSSLENFGQVLGIDLLAEQRVVLIHMAEHAAAVRALQELNGKAEGSWMWRLSINKAPSSFEDNAPPAYSMAPTAGASANLPADALLSVFSHFTARPLLTAISLVCRKWHRVAPLAVTSLRTLSDACRLRLATDPALLVKFKHLAEWSVSKAPSEPFLVPWRTRLRSLRLSDLSGPRAAFLTLSRLHTLELHVPMAAARPLLVNCASTLTSLAVHCDFAPNLGVELPNLVSLYIGTGVASVSTTQTDRWVTSVTTLSFDEQLGDHYRAQLFPRLASLCVRGRRLFHAWLERHATSLTRLDVQAADSLTPYASALSCLRSLRFLPTPAYSHALHADTGELFRKCTALRSAEIPPGFVHWDACVGVLAASFADRLHKLTLPAEPVTEGLLVQFTELRTLRCCGCKAPPNFAAWRMPHLRSLAWYGSTPEMRSLAMLDAIVSAFPGLERLQFRFDPNELKAKYPPTPSGEARVRVQPRMKELEDIIARAQRNGLTKLVLVHPREAGWWLWSSEAYIKETARLFPWLRLSYKYDRP